MALAGHGIALLDDYTVRDELEAGRLVQLLPRLRVTNTGFDLGIFAVFRPRAAGRDAGAPARRASPVGATPTPRRWSDQAGPLR